MVLSINRFFNITIFLLLASHISLNAMEEMTPYGIGIPLDPSSLPSAPAIVVDPSQVIVPEVKESAPILLLSSAPTSSLPSTDAVGEVQLPTNTPLSNIELTNVPENSHLDMVGNSELTLPIALGAIALVGAATTTYKAGKAADGTWSWGTLKNNAQAHPVKSGLLETLWASVGGAAIFSGIKRVTPMDVFNGVAHSYSSMSRESLPSVKTTVAIAGAAALAVGGYTYREAIQAGVTATGTTVKNTWDGLSYRQKWATGTACAGTALLGAWYFGLLGNIDNKFGISSGTSSLGSRGLHGLSSVGSRLWGSMPSRSSFSDALPAVTTQRNILLTLLPAGAFFAKYKIDIGRLQAQNEYQVNYINQLEKNQITQDILNVLAAVAQTRQ